MRQRHGKKFLLCIARSDDRILSRDCIGADTLVLRRNDNAPGPCSYFLSVKERNFTRSMKCENNTDIIKEIDKQKRSLDFRLN